jgi:UDP-3-O-[3-hydroxymyristoyl] N-acetylglucosamine deacetylase
MKFKRQTTIKKVVKIQGIGLHTGEKVNIILKPAPEDTGVLFKRIDLKNSPTIKADIKYVVPTSNYTLLKKGKIEILTCEHLLSAIFGMEIDNIVIEIDNREVPILDGSSLEFVNLLKKAGRIFQKKLKKFFKIKKSIFISNRNKYIIVLPSEKFRITYFLFHPHPKIGEQISSLEINRKNFIEKISPSRTFSTYSEAIFLKKTGLIKGGSLQNAVLITKKGYSSPLRNPQEFALHKILDIIGDISLLNLPIIAHIIGIKSGHLENHLLVKKMLKILKK